MLFRERSLLARLKSYTSSQQRKVMLNPLLSHFSYCPIVSMFYKISSDNRINNIHERTLGTMCQDHEASFTDLLPKNNSLITYRISSQK